MVKTSLAWTASLRPSMHDPPSPQQSQNARARRTQGTHGPRPGPKGVWQPESEPSTPKALLAITPPRPAASCKQKSQLAESVQPCNSPTRATRIAVAQSVSQLQMGMHAPELDESASPCVHSLSPFEHPGTHLPSASPARKQRRGNVNANQCFVNVSNGSPSVAANHSGLRSRSRSPLKRITSSTPESDSKYSEQSDHDTSEVLISHISQLRSALSAAYGKLDMLEQERSSLKEQLAEVVSDSGAHAARMRVLEKQLQAARRQDEDVMSNALIVAQQKNEALRQTLNHKEREVVMLTAELQERDEQTAELCLSRDKALQEVNQLRRDVGDFKPRIKLLQETLRLAEERNTDLSVQHAALEIELKESAAESHALSMQLITRSESQNATAEGCDPNDPDREDAGNILRNIFHISTWLPPALTIAGKGIEFDQVACPRSKGSALPARTGSTVKRELTSCEATASQPRLLRMNKQNFFSPVAADQNEQGEDITSTVASCARTSVERQQLETSERMHSPRASRQYVRVEVLEQVKLKAKADLVELESELMAVIVAMEAEQRGASGGGSGINTHNTPTVTPLLKPRQSQSPSLPTRVQSTPASTSTGTPWSRSAASLLTAGFTIAEHQEHIELLELEREQLCQSLADTKQELSAEIQALQFELRLCTQSKGDASSRRQDDQGNRGTEEHKKLDESMPKQEQMQCEACCEARAQTRSLITAGRTEIASLQNQVVP